MEQNLSNQNNNNPQETMLEPKTDEQQNDAKIEKPKIVEQGGSFMESKSKEVEAHDHVLFVTNLNIKTTEETLEKHFKQWGNVTKVYIVMMTGLEGATWSRCYGFVHFSSSDEVEAAQASRPHTVDGRKIVTKRALPMQQDRFVPLATVMTQYLCVNNLSTEATREDVKAYFETFGKVTKVDMMNNKTGAVVQFADYDSVDKIALQAVHVIREQQVSVRKISRTLAAQVNTPSAAKFNKPGPETFNRRNRGFRNNRPTNTRDQYKALDVAKYPHCNDCGGRDRIVVTCVDCLNRKFSMQYDPMSMSLYQYQQFQHQQEYATRWEDLNKGSRRSMGKRY